MLFSFSTVCIPMPEINSPVCCPGPEINDAGTIHSSRLEFSGSDAGPLPSVSSSSALETGLSVGSSTEAYASRVIKL